MRISDWSSDVCSSDLGQRPARDIGRHELSARPLPGPALTAAGVPRWLAKERWHRCLDDRRRTLRLERRCRRRAPRGAPPPRRPASEAAFLRSRRSEEHTSELQSLMRISYAVFCLKKKITY